MTQPNEAGHILVVDDDNRLRELLHDYLQSQGFFVLCAEDADQAREKLSMFRVDAMVLDRMMPGETGVEFIADYRPDFPVLMLTAMGEAQDRIEGLEAGAQDYLAKPFEPKELVLRLHNLLRQRQRHQPTQVRFGAFSYDLLSGALRRGDEVVYLTANEQAQLTRLAQQPGLPVSREELAACLPDGGEAASARAIDVQINRLRKKIETSPARPAYIQTVRGSGYVLKVG